MALGGDSTLSDRWRPVKKLDSKIDLDHDFQGQIFSIASYRTHHASQITCSPREKIFKASLILKLFIF